jgi:hypothetical protein
MAIVLFSGSQLKWGLTWTDTAFKPHYSGKLAIECEPAAGQLLEVVGCWRPTENSNGKTVLVLGDSQAAMIWPAVVEASSRLGYSTRYVHKLGCPFLAAVKREGQKTECQEWQRDATAYAKNLKPDIVLIANRKDGFITPGFAEAAAERAGIVAGTEQEMEDQFFERSVASILDLKSNGAGVIILGQLPRAPYIDNEPSLLRLVWHPVFRQEFDLRDVADHQRAASKMNQRIMRAAPDTLLYDIEPVLCTFNKCSLIKDDSSIYHDRTHLTSFGASLLADSLQVVLLESSKQNR